MRFHWFEERVATPLGSLSGVIYILMALISLVDIVFRSLSISVSGATEVSESLVVVAIYLGLVFTQAGRAHIGMDFALNALGPAQKRLADLASLGLTFLISLALIWATTRSAIKSIELGEYTSTAFNLPLWPAKVVLCVGLALMAVQVLIQFLRLLFDGENRVNQPSNDSMGGL
jgi:TRAP-type C4-dicarboxylate transport system permease small subunit